MPSVHLITIIHGLYGSHDNLLQAQTELERAYTSSDDKGKLQVVVLNAKGIKGSLTYDGIDVGAYSVAKEVSDEDVVARLPHQGVV